MKIAIDGPERPRETVQFANWSGPGMVIAGDKCRSDAATFRYVASLLRRFADVCGAVDDARGKKQAQDAAAGLISMAAQYDLAANGESPQAV